MIVGISLLTVALDQLGGLNLRLAALIRGLAEAGHEIITIQTKEALNGSSDFYRSVASLPVRPLAVNYRLGKGLLRWVDLPGLWRLPIGKIIPDRIDVLDLWDPLVNVPTCRPYRVVFSHNHFTPYILQHLRNCGFRSLAMFPEIPFLYGMLKGMGKRIDGYIVETERQRKWLIQENGVPEDLVAGIAPGFDAALIRSLRQSATESTSPSIVFSGRLHKWKGVHELVEAFSLLAQDHPTWDLHFVGDGLARTMLREQVQREKLRERVRFWGRRDCHQALQIVASAQVFVLPSYIESFPLSLLEAMALGLPTIATDVGGIKDHLIEEGVTGLLIPPRDAKALYDAIVQLVSSPELRLRLGVRGQERAKELTFERMVRSSAEFYTRVLNRSRP